MTDPSIARLMSNVRVRVPGATDDMLQLELFNTMDDFFKGSNAWTQDLDIFIPGTDLPGTIYQLTPDSPSIIDKLMWIFQPPVSPLSGKGQQIAGTMSTPGELVLVTQPNIPVTYRVTVSLTVADPTTRDGFVVFPEWVILKYRDRLMDGLLGKLFSQMSKPWTNNQLAVLHMRKFKQGVASARVEVERNNVFRQQAWVFPGFARGTQRGRSGWSPPQ